MQDIFFSETCRFADVILPASPSLEKEGTFTSTERRIQRLYQVLSLSERAVPTGSLFRTSPTGWAPDWNYEHPSEIYDEIASLTPLMAGVTYERLEGYKTLQWPVADDGSDQPLLYTREFNFPDGKATFFPVPWTEPTDQPDAEYDLHLNNGRLLEHFHEGNMTYRTEGIREKTPCTFVEVSPELADERGIQTGSWVQLTSRYGKVRAQAVITSRVQGKELYMPMNSVDEPVNRLTSSHTDKATHTPAYKETSVQLRVLGEIGDDPLPRTNSRHGHPTPQQWRRSGTQMEAQRLSPTWRSTGSDPDPLDHQLARRQRWLDLFLLSYRPAIHAKSCASGWNRLQLSTLKPCSTRTNCCSSYTNMASSSCCAVRLAQARN